MKRLVAYSSVSHMGFVMLGLYAFNNTGVTGGVLQMVNHGLSTGALFILVGLIYDRRTRARSRSTAASGASCRSGRAFFLVVTLSSIGLPGPERLRRRVPDPARRLPRPSRRGRGRHPRRRARRRLHADHVQARRLRADHARESNRSLADLNAARDPRGGADGRLHRLDRRLSAAVHRAHRAHGRRAARAPGEARRRDPLPGDAPARPRPSRRAPTEPERPGLDPRGAGGNNTAVSMANILTRLFGSANDRTIKRLLAAGPARSASSRRSTGRSPTSAFPAKTAEWRAQLTAEEMSLDDLLPEAFAAVREAAPADHRAAPLRRAVPRRHRAAPGQDRRDEDRRGQDAGRDAAALPERAHRQGRAPGHRQRLPGPPRRAVDGADLPLPRPHASARSSTTRASSSTRRYIPKDYRFLHLRPVERARRLPRRHHLRHEQRVRLRLPARQHEVRARRVRPARAATTPSSTRSTTS